MQDTADVDELFGATIFEEVFFALALKGVLVGYLPFGLLATDESQSQHRIPQNMTTRIHNVAMYHSFNSLACFESVRGP